jgi:hypothetical protein
LEQGRSFCSAGGKPLILGQSFLRHLEVLSAHQSWHWDCDPLLRVSRPVAAVACAEASFDPQGFGDAHALGLLRFSEAGTAMVCGIFEHPPNG